MPTYTSTFALGQTVFLVTDPLQQERLVTGVEFTGNHGVLYKLSCGMDVSCHYELEISAKVNQARKLGFEEMSN